MNHQDYIKAAQALTPITKGKTPWVLAKLKDGSVKPLMRAFADEVIGDWLNIDDFSGWSAARIAAEVFNKMGIEGTRLYLNLDVSSGVFKSNLDTVKFIIEAHKIKPAAVEAAIPKE